MKTKVLLLIILACFLVNLAAAEKLGMFIEAKRYLNEQKNTRIDYQVPYKNLTFMTREKSFFAELQVTLTISNADSVLVTRQFTNNIGVTQKYDITTSSKSYLDRISLTLAKPGYKLDLKFEDLNADKAYEWSYETQQLGRDEKLSDLELITFVTADSVSYSRKFMRNNLIYIPEPSGLISRELHDSIYFYCQAYDIMTDKVKAVLTVMQDSIPVFIQTYNLTQPAKLQELYYPVGIASFNAGAYMAIIELVDEETTYSRSYEFIITEQTEQMYFIFTDL
jgi:hypothetical protein